MRISDWSSDVCSSDLPVERIAERDLARQARIVVAVGHRIEQVVLVLAHRGHRGGVARLDMDMARRAREAAAAQREQLVEARVADIQIGRASCRERVCQYV